MRPHFCGQFPWLPMLLPGGLQASVANERQFQERGVWGGGVCRTGTQRVNAKAEKSPWNATLDTKSLLSSSIVRPSIITCVHASRA